MSSLKANFDELMVRLQAGRELTHASFEPVYYLVFPPGQILDVKRMRPALIARLRNDGWDVHVFSIAEHILDILKKAPLREVWIEADRKNPLDWDKANESIGNLLSRGVLKERLENQLQELRDRKSAILLVTDLEALHPYLRIGAIESQLYGEFNIPTIFFYPGVRTGKTRLKFLGFYPSDGNYRSVHVGG